MKKTKKIILCALLLACNIILSRILSIKISTIKFSFSFVPGMLCGIWLGPVYSVFMKTAADLLGANLFPTGPYFYGYTITAALSGLIYGVILYKKKKNTYTEKEFIIRIILATLLVTILLNLGLNTYWMSKTSGKSYKYYFYSRCSGELAQIPFRIIIILFLEKSLRKPFDKYIRDKND